MSLGFIEHSIVYILHSWWCTTFLGSVCNNAYCHVFIYISKYVECISSRVCSLVYTLRYGVHSYWYYYLHT